MGVFPVPPEAKLPTTRTGTEALYRLYKELLYIVLRSKTAVRNSILMGNSAFLHKAIKTKVELLSLEHDDST